MRTRDLAALGHVAGLAFEAAQARLAALARQEEGLRAALAALDQARAARAAQALAPDVALRAGADPLWHGWLDGRRAALNLDLARLSARIEMARAESRRAYGRSLATEELRAQARAALATQRQRREDRGP